MDRDNLHGFVLGETLDEGLLEDGYHPDLYKFYGHHSSIQDLKDILQRSSEKSRGLYH